MAFRIGQEVVYIGPKYNGYQGCNVPAHDIPEPDKIYTIENITPIGNLELVGMSQPGNGGTWEVGYNPKVFRPVVKPKRKASTETGMEMLREIAARETIPTERERLKRRKIRVP